MNDRTLEKLDKIDNHIVFWSGGMDSTLIVYDLLKKGLKVELVYFNDDCLTGYQEDLKARTFFIDNFKKYYPNMISYNVIDVNLIDTWQLPNWAAFVGLYVKDNSFVYLGYIKTSFFWHKKTEFENVIYNICKIRNITNISIKYPHEYDTKKKIIEKAKSIGIYDKCSITCVIEGNEIYE